MAFLPVDHVCFGLPHAEGSCLKSTGSTVLVSLPLPDRTPLRADRLFGDLDSAIPVEIFSGDIALPGIAISCGALNSAAIWLLTALATCGIESRSPSTSSSRACILNLTLNLDMGCLDFISSLLAKTAGG